MTDAEDDAAVDAVREHFERTQRVLLQALTDTEDEP